jgi:hypothetical protein
MSPPSAPIPEADTGPVPFTPLPPQIDLSALPDDLRAACCAAYDLAAQAGLAATVHYGLVGVSIARLRGVPPGEMPHYPHTPETIAAALAEVDRLTPDCLRLIPPLRHEYIRCRAGWNSPSVPATTAHDAAVAYARLVRDRLDALVRVATGNYADSTAEYRPLRELVDCWPKLVVVARRNPPPFADLPAATEVLTAVLREAALAANARRANPRSDVPKWNRAERQLQFQGAVIRNYSKRKAVKQEQLLDKFQEALWPTTVQAPFDGRALKEAIDAFNDRVTPGTIKLRGDGTGKGVSWSPVPASESTHA